MQCPYAIQSNGEFCAQQQQSPHALHAPSPCQGCGVPGSRSLRGCACVKSGRSPTPFVCRAHSALACVPRRPAYDMRLVRWPGVCNMPTLFCVCGAGRSAVRARACAEARVRKPRPVFRVGDGRGGHRCTRWTVPVGGPAPFCTILMVSTPPACVSRGGRCCEG